MPCLCRIRAGSVPTLGRRDTVGGVTRAAPSATVRDATPADAEAIARVHVAAWQEGYRHVFGAERLATLSVAERAERWREILSRGGEARTIVAERGGSVVGFAGVGPTRDAIADVPPGELYAIYVDPTDWGGGAGRALLAAAVDALRAARYSEACLWVLEDNPRARRFYEREGWQPDGARRHGEHLGVPTVEIRYRRRLEESS